MRTRTLVEEANELKNVLAPYDADTAKMRELFDEYVLRFHNASPGSMHYNDLVTIFAAKAGMRGYLEAMGVL